jgi:transposase
MLNFFMFHVMKPVNEELNKVRKQTRMTLKESKFILLKNGVDLTPGTENQIGGHLKAFKTLKTGL